MSWGRKNNSSDPDKPAAFTGDDLYKMGQATNSLCYTNLGIHAEPFTAEELADLFCPSSLLRSVQQVYSVETNTNAVGDIYIDLMKLLPEPPKIFSGEPGVDIRLSRAVLNIEFKRENMPTGFITPAPVFGYASDAVGLFKGPADSLLKQRFITQMHEMIEAGGRWSTVYWMLHRLQETVRTPPQLRYLWPAAYSLASIGKAKVASTIVEASSRAAINAVLDPQLAPYLKPTYEVVANSVLLGIKEEFETRYRSGQMRFHSYAFEVTLPDGTKGFVGGI